jgi:DNA-binding NtrC family response regulator
VSGTGAAIEVLLVDDEKELCRSLSRVLRRRGFEVSTAWSGDEALEILKRHRIEVAVVDVKMPGMDGHALFAELRQRDPLIEVILLTGHATAESAAEGKRQGVFDYLLKPEDPEQLASLIRAAADRRRRRQAEGPPGSPSV